MNGDGYLGSGGNVWLPSSGSGGGSSSSSMRVLADFITSVSNVGTGETDLYSYPAPVNTLISNGEKLIAQFSGTFNDPAATSR